MATKPIKSITVNSTKYTITTPTEAIFVKLTAPDDGDNYPNFNSTTGWSIDGWEDDQGNAITTNSELYAKFRAGAMIIADVNISGTTQHLYLRECYSAFKGGQWYYDFTTMYDYGSDIRLDYLALLGWNEALAQMTIDKVVRKTI